MPKVYRKLEEIDFSRYIINEKGIYSKHWKRYISGKTTNEGYIVVSMCDKNGKKHQYPYHRVIAYALIPKPYYLEDVPYEHLDVDHINGIRNDNRVGNGVENLRWCTHKDNTGFDGTRKRKRDAMKGVNAGDKNGNYGKIFSEEERTHLSEKLQNRKDLSKPVIQYDKEGEFVTEYPSVMEAARQTGLKQQYISRVCTGERKSYKGFIWKYA